MNERIGTNIIFPLMSLQLLTTTTTKLYWLVDNITKALSAARKAIRGGVEHAKRKEIKVKAH